MTTDELHELAASNDVTVTVTFSDREPITGTLLFVAADPALDQIGLRTATNYAYPPFSSATSFEVVR